MGLTNQTDFAIDAWQTDDGLPQSSVNSIAQTPDGYLWLATFNGLARFDGVRFTVFDSSNLPGLPGNRLVRLYVDREGGLWMITEYNEVARLKDGRCRTFTAADGVPAEGARWVGEDGRGGRWLAGFKAGLWRWQNGRFVPVPAPPGFAEWPLRALVTDTAGRPWFNHRDGLFGFENGRLIPLPESAGPPKAGANPVCASRAGGFWMVSPAGLRRHVEGNWLPQLWPCPDFKAAIEGLCEDPAGNLWVETYKNGVFRFSPAQGWQHLTVESGLTPHPLRSLYCDREGNVWAGSDGGGLLRIKTRLWKMITRGEGLGIDAVHSVCQDQQGRIWFGGGTTKPYWLDQGVVSVAIAAPQSDVLDGVRAVLPARDGAMWIGTYGGNVFRYRNGALTRYGKAEGLLAGSVRALLEDRQGTLWVGGFDGLSRIDRERVTHYSRRDGLSSERVWALAEDSKARLYVGTAGGGLNRFQDGRFTAYTREQGLPDDVIQALYVDAEDVLWIGTHGGGLSRFQAGRFFNYRVKGGLVARGVGPMLEDDEGRLWMASDLGIVRVSRHELNEFAAGRRRSVNYVAFDRSDGLATVEVGGIQPACLKARDGKLWFGTAKGATFVDPKELRVNPLPPPVIIDEVRIDDEVVEEQRSEVRGQESGDGGGGETEKRRDGETASADARAQKSPSPRLSDSPFRDLVTLQPHQRRVEFRFTGLSFTAPAKVQFRYRMEGFDPDWVDGGTARSASYTRLPPGTYRFRVTACNNDGVWNETGASLALIVVPAWWQTGWFQALALLGVGGVVFGLYEWRILQLKRRRAMQHEFSRRLIASQENERQRIAGELHDGLGQNLLVIKNLAALGVRSAQNDPAKSEQFTAISHLASQAVGEVRQIAHALRPFELDRLGLTKALTWMVKPVAESSNIRFSVEMDEVDGLFPPEFEINLYRVVQESLSNILKHSQATTARLQVKREPRQVRVTIQDQGRGFVVPTAASASASGGMGLTDMSERVRIMGGQFSIESAPGAGTLLRLLIPLPAPGPGSKAQTCL